MLSSTYDNYFYFVYRYYLRFMIKYKLFCKNTGPIQTRFFGKTTRTVLESIIDPKKRALISLDP